MRGFRLHHFAAADTTISILLKATRYFGWPADYADASLSADADLAEGVSQLPAASHFAGQACQLPLIRPASLASLATRYAFKLQFFITYIYIFHFSLLPGASAGSPACALLLAATFSPAASAASLAAAMPADISSADASYKAGCFFFFITYCYFFISILITYTLLSY